MLRDVADVGGFHVRVVTVKSRQFSVSYPSSMGSTISGPFSSSTAGLSISLCSKSSMKLRLVADEPKSK